MEIGIWGGGGVRGVFEERWRGRGSRGGAVGEKETGVEDGRGLWGGGAGGEGNG